MLSIMKTKLIIISIALVSIASLGATKLVKNEREELAKASTTKPQSAPIGGLVAEDK